MNLYVFANIKIVAANDNVGIAAIGLAAHENGVIDAKVALQTPQHFECASIGRGAVMLHVHQLFNGTCIQLGAPAFSCDFELGGQGFDFRVPAVFVVAHGQGENCYD